MKTRVIYIPLAASRRASWPASAVHWCIYLHPDTSPSAAFLWTRDGTGLLLPCTDWLLRLLRWFRRSIARFFPTRPHLSQWQRGCKIRWHMSNLWLAGENRSRRLCDFLTTKERWRTPTAFSRRYLLNANLSIPLLVVSFRLRSELLKLSSHGFWQVWFTDWTSTMFSSLSTQIQFTNYLAFFVGHWTTWLPQLQNFDGSLKIIQTHDIFLKYYE